MDIEKAIKDKLKGTLDCQFKKAWLPKGWACVKIDVFAKELAEILKKKL